MAVGTQPRRTEALLPPSAWTALARADLEPSTCWDFPHQASGPLSGGDPSFNGVTPSSCVVNLVRRYTQPGDLVVDPMAGSGTVSDVARSLGRRAAAFDIAPRRGDVAKADARAWPLPDEVARLAVIDSPYSDNLRYSEEPGCLGRLSCRDHRFYAEMARVASEAHRALLPGGVLAWIISDEYKAGAYTPAGFRLFEVLQRTFEPIDTVVLVRHHDRSASPMWQHLARRFNFFLRGFKFLFILRKPSSVEGGTNRGQRTGTDE